MHERRVGQVHHLLFIVAARTEEIAHVDMAIDSRLRRCYAGTPGYVSGF